MYGLSLKRHDILFFLREFCFFPLMSMKKTFSAMTAAIAFSSFAVTAMAAGSFYTLFGVATEIGGGEIELVSDAANAEPYGGLEFSVPAGLTFADLTTLSLEYNVTDDDCGGGSPRFAIGLDTDNNGTQDGYMFVYAGPFPNYVGCTQNTWETDGNLLDGSRPVDSGQLGGTFYDPYANALANYGSAAVTKMILVIDSSWKYPDGEQTILVRNIDINGPVSPLGKDACKKGGWVDLGFKNQGQCVSSFASKNK